MNSEKILVTGANGQIGTVLTRALQEAWGADNVIATDIRSHSSFEGRFEALDVLQKDQVFQLIKKEGITQIYHLAAILSAKGEQDPVGTWEINMGGFFNLMEAARMPEVRKIFFPSSIAVFGSHSPSENTPQSAMPDPETVYGISKVAAEYWCQYYYQKYGLDVRSVRYPGIIGYQSLPGGGTTDYAIDIFHKAAQGLPYSCFLKDDAALPMLYMDDAIRATMEVMNAPAEALTVRTSYNLSGMSFTPAQLEAEIKKQVPDFIVHYEPDFRQKIAEAWPKSIDDQPARLDWGWKEAFDLSMMTVDMLEKLAELYASSDPTPAV